jgi:peptidoglycan/LPS O-acetylase OafA/YrhL
MQKPEIKSLTGIRAFASWWVVFYHLQGGIAQLFPASRNYLSTIRRGDAGVDLFFVLSGFVLAYNYHDAFATLTRKSYGRFLWQRLARIYPVHCLGLATWGSFAVLNVFLKHREVGVGYFGGKALLAQLLLVQSWSIPIVMSWNYPAWSISMEWLAYLCFPFLIRYFMKKSGSIALPLIAVCVLGLGAPFLMTTTAEHFVRIAAEFTAGCLLYLLFSRGFGRQISWNWVAPVLFFVTLALSEQLGRFILPAFILLIYSLLFDRGLAAAVFGSRLCMYWGRVSYSLYIMHAAVISACHYLLPISRFMESSGVVKIAVLGAYLTAVGVSGALAYHYVEEPCRRGMRRWFRFDRVVRQTEADRVSALQCETGQ